MGFFTARRAFRWFVRLVLVVAVLVGIGYGYILLHNRRSAPRLLQHALLLADLNNWADAEPEFRRATEILQKKGDHRGELYTRLAIIRATAQHRNLHDAVAEIDELLRTEPL